MRVAMLGPFGLRPKGTMAVRALPLAQALTARGHAVTLILPPWSFPDDAGKTWDDGGVRIENVPITPRAQIPFRMFTALRAFRPDVVHVFKPKAYSGAVQWLLWQMRRVGMANVRIILDEDDWEGAGGWNDLELYSGSLKKVFSWQESWGLTHADVVTVASRALETIAWSHGIGRERVYYLPNGVNALPPSTLTGETVREQLGLRAAPVLLLYTRFFEYDLARVGRVISGTLQFVPNVKILLVGRGLYGEEQKFLELAQSLGWQDRVLNVGWVEPNTLRGYFAAADVALFPFDDTLVNRCKCSVKLVDLLANGVPVVAEAVGQTKEYIRHNETGILVPPGDERTFITSVVEVLNDSAKHKQLGACAAVAMAAAYSWEKLAEIAICAYEG